MRILGIESSADDSGIALIEAEGGFGPEFRFSALAHEVATQRHAEYGGIFPNVAKNEHIKNLPLLFEKMQKRFPEKPDAIAVTTGPGLEPCLWAGISFAQRLASNWRVPVVSVNHLEGHIIMSMIENVSQSLGKLHAFEFPVLALLISGGNTQLVLAREAMHYEVIGKTRDDAVGEAFDKVARMLGLPYPGGPEVANLARRAREAGAPPLPPLPRPMLHEHNFDFSFSGLKTAVLRAIEAQERIEYPLSDTFKQQLAREFEEAAADVLVKKTIRAVEEYGASTVLTGGGVSANEFIRSRLTASLEEAGVAFLVCPREFSTDNALMIALVGYFRALRNEFTAPEDLMADGNLKLC